MAKQEYPFCETEGKRITFLNPVAVVETLKAKPRLSLENILNLFFVVKECIKSKSDSWVIRTEFHEYPILKTIPLMKRKPSEEKVKLMIEYYQTSSDDDLALAKEFEGIDTPIDDESCK
jgi:hypothetical protein